jgi:biotin transporter BioY
VAYVYLADRLAELHDELKNPRPRGWLERQMERKSGARYMMMATLIGVIFAVILGMASLAVSSYQTWIAYQAWQHPIVPQDAAS